MKKTNKFKAANAGFGLMELLLAMFVLVVGLLGGMMMVLIGMSRNNTNRVDTTATNVAQTVLEQIAGAPANSNPTLTVTDCHPNTLKSIPRLEAPASRPMVTWILCQHCRLPERQQLPDELHDVRQQRAANDI